MIGEMFTNFQLLASLIFFIIGVYSIITTRLMSATRDDQITRQFIVRIT